MRILIIGGSGGIGFALIKQVLQSYSSANVVATYNRKQISFQHPRLTWRQLDIKNEGAIAEFAKQTDKVDILINAIGVLHADGHMPEKSVKQFDSQFFQHNIELNTLPSILLAKYFMNALRADSNSFFVVLSARIGSISDNQLGGWLSYRVSKAAVNMAMKTIAIEWQRMLPNCRVLLFHPGTTDTEFSKPFQKRLPKGQLHSAEVTAKALVELLQKPKPQDSAKFISFDGSEIPW